MNLGGALAPSTAYIYDWNILPIGQQLWSRAPDAASTSRMILEQVQAARAKGD